MKSINFLNSLCKTTAIAFGLSTLVFSSDPAKANELSPCGDAAQGDKAYTDFSNNQQCMVSATDKYAITIYEMGICKANPLTVGNPSTMDYTSCAVTLTSPNGTEVDLVASSQVNLPRASTRPTNGSYRYAYGKIGYRIKLKGSYTMANGDIWYSGTNGNAVNNVNNFVEYNHDLKDFGDGGFSEDWGPQNMPGSGNVSAVLVGTDGIGAADANDVDKLIGIFEADLGQEVLIDDATLGLNMELRMTNAGHTIEWETRGGGGAQPDTFWSGPFKPIFKVIK